jgi:hypothetical protein
MVLLVGIARSGARYFYCAMMGTALSHACCAAADEPADGPAVDAPECCEKRQLERLPSGSAVTPFELESLPPTEIAPTNAVEIVVHMHAATSIAHEARAGPPPPARRRATIMIWNC